MGVDALQCNINVLFRRGVNFNYGCTCPAKSNEMSLHSESCGVSPIYASVCDNVPMIVGSFHAMNALLTQTAIPCAYCRKLCWGKNLLIVYRYWDSDVEPEHPDNILKAICLECNTFGGIVRDGVPRV